MNSTEFASEEVQLRTVEKAIIVTLWLFIESLGSILLIGLIEFERLGGDPLKRRIVDQVRTVLHFHAISIYLQTLFFATLAFHN